MDIDSQVGGVVVAFEQLPVFLEGSSTWQTVADFPKLCQLPKSLARPDGAPGPYLSDNRLKLQSLPCQQSYAKTLGCPFDPAQIDRHLLSHIIWSLSCQLPRAR
jgi:hypothetical protein